MRRTAAIDMTWPEGRGGPLLLSGTARDLLTPNAGEARVLATASMSVLLAPDRTVQAIETDPPLARIGELVGARGGGGFRKALQAVAGEIKASGHPLYLLLDDVAGSSLIAGWAWSRWADDWISQEPAGGPKPQGQRSMSGGRDMTDVCTGFAAGSSALTADGGAAPNQNARSVPPLAHPDDPLSWQPLTFHNGPSMRRARRIDVWRDADLLHIDATFQDSASEVTGARTAVHEYALRATTRDGVLLAVEAEPRVLPYRECPGAALNMVRVIGMSLEDARSAVLASLPGPLGCTHLNDALRALADVPSLAAALV